jgi:fatty-acyl-CoA synthase
MVEVAGATVMRGYWNRPDLTAQVLRDGWLRTGDLGLLDEDGYLYLTGREKDLVIVDGTKCHPQAVEEVLLTHPAIRQAAVIGVPDERTGEALVAVCVMGSGVMGSGVMDSGLSPDRTGVSDELRGLVRDALGPGHVPGRIEFVSSIPTAAYGKPDKAALRRGFAVEEPIPDHA